MMRVYAIGAALAAAAMVGGTYVMTSKSTDAFADCRASSIGTGVASIGGPLSLVNEDGKAVTEAEMFTKPTLLYFGYTFCPDVCPLDNARNAEALDLVQANGQDAQMAFVTIDPERDDVEAVRDFTSYLHDDMTGYTGTPEQIKAASLAYKTYYRAQPPEEGMEDYYLVDHSTFTYLVLPEIGFVEFFKRDDTAQDMAQKVGCFIDASGA